MRPEQHHIDCDYRNSHAAKETSELFGVDIEENSEVFECNLGCGDEQPLNDLMEFGHIIEVRNGKAFDSSKAADLYPPDLYWIGSSHVIEDGSWDLLDGYSGQCRYSGPIMHASEYIGGRIEKAILSRDGFYVALACDDIDGQPVGWAVAYRES